LFGFLRFAGALLFALIGWYIADLIPYATLPAPLDNPILLHLLIALVPAVAAFFLLPPVLRPPMEAFLDQLSHASGVQILADFIGSAMGLLIAALLAFPLALLPEPFRQVLPLLCVVLFAYLGVMIMNARYREFFAILNIKVPAAKGDEHAAGDARSRERVLLDTSVIIDGRIADIVATGFIRGDLVVPRFVLNEVQHVADSPDALRRSRGRRGLEILKRLRASAPDLVRIIDDEGGPSREVDEKLITLARLWSCPIMTNDYNLNKVATLQGVTVLNVNELANAVKAVLLPGESLTVRIIQAGKEIGQGVGYLDDGTMVVVEDGQRRIDDHVSVVVTKVLQTAAGRMIFAKPSVERPANGD
jgi:uncharacterized protein YacL